jgi:hypothetical protein
MVIGASVEISGALFNLPNSYQPRLLFGKEGYCQPDNFVSWIDFPGFRNPSFWRISLWFGLISRLLETDTH